MKDNRCVLWGRISHKEQSRYSIDYQEAQTERQALEDGMQVVKRWFVDEQGSNPEQRPKFQEMIRFVRDNKIPFLYMMDTDRLGRNDDDFLTIKHLREDFLTVVFVGEGYSLGSELDDEYDRESLHDNKRNQSTQLKRMLRRNTRRGHANKRNRGGRLGISPLGYRNDKLNKTHIPDDERWNLVKRIFTEYEKNIYSDAEVARRISDLGLRTRPTRRFPQGCTISKHVVRSILTNRFYCGFVQNSEGEWIEGVHKPMISESLFEKCQRIRNHEERQAVRKRTQRVFHPFKNLVVCGFCGSTMTFQRQFKKNGKVYTYLTCAGKHLKGKDYCQQKYYPQRQIDEIFEGVVDNVTYDARSINIADWIAENNDSDFAEVKSKIRKLEEEIKELDRRGI